jgi:hypothetical protein
MVELNSTKISEASPLPIFGCVCGSRGATIVEGGMDYEQVSTDNYGLKQIVCGGCKRSDNTSYTFLPA